MDRSGTEHPLAQYTTYISLDFVHFMQKVLVGVPPNVTFQRNIAPS